MINNKDIDHFEKAKDPDYFGLEAMSSTEDNITIDVIEPESENEGSDEETSESSITEVVENDIDPEESNDESVTFDSLANESKPIVEDKNPSAIGNRPAPKGGNNKTNKKKGGRNRKRR